MEEAFGAIIHALHVISFWGFSTVPHIYLQRFTLNTVHAIDINSSLLKIFLSYLHAIKKKHLSFHINFNSSMFINIIIIIIIIIKANIKPKKRKVLFLYDTYKRNIW
jgi:hypothetical protein